MGAERYGERLAYRDQPDRERWSGRPPLEWTYAVANRMVDRLAGFFTRSGLPPAGPVGLHLPAGSELWLTFLALDRAGLTPCPIPAGWAEADLSHAIEAAHLQAVITQGRLGADRPAETLRRVMSGQPRLRLAGAFGPDLPDGIVDLDRVMLARMDDEEPRRGAPAGRVTFGRRGDAPNAVYRPAASIMAATGCLSRGRQNRAGRPASSL
jgi:non-ribosomal peptide synthetase component E (peptide arylation enzyme)